MAKRALKQKFQVSEGRGVGASGQTAAGVRTGKRARQRGRALRGNSGEHVAGKCEVPCFPQDGLALFNTKPRKGIEMLQKEGMLGTSPADVAVFLAKTQV